MKPAFPPSPNPSHLANHAESLRTALTRKMADTGPELLAANTGSRHQPAGNSIGIYLLPLWGKEIQLAYPDWQAVDSESNEPLPLFNQAFILYYFLTADGAPVNQSWISFSQLPDGRFYNQAFQGYTGAELARTFKNEISWLGKAAQSAGGSPVPIEANVPGNSAWRFQALPRVSLMLAAWEGDEDFPASYQVLFDGSVPHYLPTDVCALLGSTLTRKLIAALK